MMPQPTDTDRADELLDEDAGQSDATTTDESSDDERESVAADTPDDSAEGSDPESDPETFPREYVQELRSENARYREKAKTAEHYAQRLHVALVASTGRLADPEDLPYDETHLDDPEALTAAIEALLERKPHLKSRRVVGDVGQGAGGATSDVDLAGILRRLA